MTGLETSRGGHLRYVLALRRCILTLWDGRGKGVLPVSVRLHMGPASTQVGSSTQVPSSACWIPPGPVRTHLGVTDLVDVYGVDVHLVYALWGHVHYVVRAQRSSTEVPSEHLCFKLFCGPLGKRSHDGLFCAH